MTRYPNPHIAFGFGTHFCLGDALAQLEIRTFFEELLRRVGEVRVVEGSVVEMPNAFVYGIKSAVSSGAVTCLARMRSLGLAPLGQWGVIADPPPPCGGSGVL